MPKCPRVEAALFDVPWAIRRGKLDEIIDGMSARLSSGLAIDMDSFEPMTMDDPVLRDDGIFVLPIRGTLLKRVGPFESQSGATQQPTLQSALWPPSLMTT